MTPGGAVSQRQSSGPHLSNKRKRLSDSTVPESEADDCEDDQPLPSIMPSGTPGTGALGRRGTESIASESDDSALTVEENMEVDIQTPKSPLCSSKVVPSSLAMGLNSEKDSPALRTLNENGSDTSSLSSEEDMPDADSDTQSSVAPVSDVPPTEKAGVPLPQRTPLPTVTESEDIRPKIISTAEVLDADTGLPKCLIFGDERPRATVLPAGREQLSHQGSQICTPPPSVMSHSSTPAGSSRTPATSQEISGAQPPHQHNIPGSGIGNALDSRVADNHSIRRGDRFNGTVIASSSSLIISKTREPLAEPHLDLGAAALPPNTIAHKQSLPPPELSNSKEAGDLLEIFAEKEVLVPQVPLSNAVISIDFISEGEAQLRREKALVKQTFMGTSGNGVVGSAEGSVFDSAEIASTEGLKMKVPPNTVSYNVPMARVMLSTAESSARDSSRASLLQHDLPGIASADAGIEHGPPDLLSISSHPSIAESVDQDDRGRQNLGLDSSHINGRLSTVPRSPDLSDFSDLSDGPEAPDHAISATITSESVGRHAYDTFTCDLEQIGDVAQLLRRMDHFVPLQIKSFTTIDKQKSRDCVHSTIKVVCAMFGQPGLADALTIPDVYKEEAPEALSVMIAINATRYAAKGGSPLWLTDTVECVAGMVVAHGDDLPACSTTSELQKVASMAKFYTAMREMKCAKPADLEEEATKVGLDLTDMDRKGQTLAFRILAAGIGIKQQTVKYRYRLGRLIQDLVDIFGRGVCALLTTTRLKALQNIDSRIRKPILRAVMEDFPETLKVCARMETLLVAPMFKSLSAGPAGCRTPSSELFRAARLWGERCRTMESPSFVDPATLALDKS